MAVGELGHLGEERSARASDRNGTIPPGWRHNPTSLRRRALLAVLAAAGFGIALYLTLFQFDAWTTVWDPWFDSRTVLELTSPVPDALAGVLAYGTELLLLALGGRDRWRTLPWVCLALGAVLTGGAVVSIALIIIQPTVAGAWCTLCLVSAAISLLLFVLGIGEARAAWQAIRRSVARGWSFGDAFWGRAAVAREPSPAPAPVPVSGGSHGRGWLPVAFMVGAALLLLARRDRRP
jgi:hypothetical protein